MGHRQHQFPADDQVRLDSFVTQAEIVPGSAFSFREVRVFLPSCTCLLSTNGTPNLSFL